MPATQAQLGLYFITNLVNQKTYVGSATNIKQRWSKHKHDLTHNIHNNKHLQAAWNAYGAENFIFEIAELIEKSLLITTEQLYLDIIKLMPYRYYNVATTALSGAIGLKHTTESKQKMSLAKKGRKLSNAHKLKISKAKLGHPGFWLGKSRTFATKYKISQSLRK